MNVETVGTDPAQVATQKVADKLEVARKEKKEAAPDAQAAEKKQVQPEELLQQIKGLTEEGVYSVRFENDESANEVVVKIVDRETEEVIRQVPAQEVLNMKAALDDLRGNLVDTKS